MKSFKFLIIVLLISLKSYSQQYGNWVRSNCYSFIETRIKFEESYPINNGKYTERNVLVQIKNNSSKRINLSYIISINRDIRQVYKIVNGNLQTHDYKDLSSGVTGVLEIDPYQTITDGLHMVNIQDNQTLWLEITCIKEYNNDNKTLKQYYTRCDNGNLCSACQFSSTSSCDDNINSNSKNSTGSNGTSSMNRGGNESTGWNGNNGNSNNNYNQQIQNQNSKTTEAFDLYNSTGNYEEARRKLIEAKNNAPDEASRQVAQQNIDKLDKVERKNQNVETISKTIDFTTDLIKTIREENKKNILAQIEQRQKEEMARYELYSNKLLIQLEKINALESNTKTIDDYKILIKELEKLKEIYNKLSNSIPMNDMVEYKIKQDYFKEKEKESQIRINKTLLKMYESGFRLNLNEIGQIIDFSNYNLISNIIEILKNNPSNNIGKSSYEIAYLSNIAVSRIIGEIAHLTNKSKYPRIMDETEKNKIQNPEEINTYLKYFLDTEYKYLEISNNNNDTDASLLKNIYLLYGWYNLKPDINTAISNLQILVNSKKINERYTKKSFYQFYMVDKSYSSYNLPLESVKVINSLFIEENGKASVAKKIKQEFDKALISIGYNEVPEYKKNSRFTYKNIGDIYFDSNYINIIFSSLENAIIFKNFNVLIDSSSISDYTDVDDEYFIRRLELKIIKNEIKTHNYFFNLITNQK